MQLFHKGGGFSPYGGGGLSGSAANGEILFIAFIQYSYHKISKQKIAAASTQTFNQGGFGGGGLSGSAANAGASSQTFNQGGGGFGGFHG